MSEVNEQRRTLYLDPKMGWTEIETADSRLKISSLWRTPEVRTIVENTIYRRHERGGWNDMNPSDRVQLTGRELGFEFEAKPRVSEGGSFIEISSARYVDQDMKPLLEGIPLFDLELRPIKPPQAAGHFCIPASSMPDFAQRVVQMSGTLSESQADLQVMHAKLQRMGAISAELEMLCSESRAVIDQVAGGMATEVPSISERCGRAHALYGEAGRLLRGIHEEKLSADKTSGQVEAQAHAEAYAENAEQWMEHIERLHREHVSYEAQAKLRTKQSISQVLPGVESAAASARYLMMDVVEFYTQQGYDCRLTRDGMILVLGETIVELGEKPSVRNASGETSAEQILGRASAERTQREL